MSLPDPQLHILSLMPECPAPHGGRKCFLCKEAKATSGKPSVHPVDAYRAWDRFYEPGKGESIKAALLHWSTPWLLSRKFLENEGNSMKLHSYTNTEQSVLVCPAVDKHGNEVIIKSVPISEKFPEYQINNLLNSPASRADSRNHTVPIAEILHFNPDFRRFGRDARRSDSRAFIVMPRFKQLETLGPYYAQCIPPDVGACLEFARQLAEGLVFMHELGIFHGDIHVNNVVVSTDSHKKPRYHYIDFQASSYFPRPWKSPPRMLATCRAHSTTPGVSENVPYDPFPSDIYGLAAGVFRPLFTFDPSDHWQHVPGFWDLMDRMEDEDPSKRPNAEHVVSYFETTLSATPQSVLRLPMKRDMTLDALHDEGKAPFVANPRDLFSN